MEVLAGTPAPLDAFVNHLLPLLVMWTFAWLCVQRRVAEEDLARRQLDLAQQVQARTAELAASEQRYPLQAENATGAVWAVDMDGTIRGHCTGWCWCSIPATPPKHIHYLYMHTDIHSDVVASAESPSSTGKSDVFLRPEATLCKVVQLHMKPNLSSS
jgi:hypothetical protein